MRGLSGAILRGHLAVKGGFSSLPSTTQSYPGILGSPLIAICPSPGLLREGKAVECFFLGFFSISWSTAQGLAARCSKKQGVRMGRGRWDPSVWERKASKP